MKAVLEMVFAAVFTARPVPRAEGPLEPSVQNEVDHAVSRGARWLALGYAGAATTNACAEVAALTNGLTRAEIAVRLVSGQRGAGWWLTPTNDAPTRTALEILKGL